jgi:PAS domain S-box-containing protein
MADPFPRIEPVSNALSALKTVPPPATVPVAGIVRSPGAAELQRLLAAIVESCDDAILTKDLDGIITSWNAGAERMYGYPPQEAIGRPVSMLVPAEIEDDVPRLMSRLQRGERIDHYETVRVTRTGRRLNVSLTISPVHDENGRVTGASTVARDITGRKLEEVRWRLLSKVGQALPQALDGEELLQALARLLVGEMADYCITYLLQDGRIRRVGTAHAEPAQEATVRRLVDVAPPTLEDPYGAGAVIRTGAPALVSEIPPQMLKQAAGGSGEYLRILQALEPVSSMVLPLCARGRTVGALALAATMRSNRRYGEDDLAFGRELADRAALALDNVRLYAQARAELARREAAERSLQRRYDQLRALYQMADAAGRAGELEEIYQCALDGLRLGLGVQRASVLLFDPDGVMRFKAWRGLSHGYRRDVEGHTPWAPDAADPAPIALPDVEADTGLEPALRATILAEGIRGMAFIPLVFGGRLLGKFMLYFDAPRTLADEETELARTIAGTIAFAIARMRDGQSAREAKEEAEKANEAKSQFLGIMSHELRTPLNAVLGYTELLLLEIRGPINAQQREQLERIQLSTRHQLGLVEELLAYTRLEAGREEPRLIETDARRVIMDVAELVRPEADAKGLRLTLCVADTPLPLRTDPARLRQVVLNLAGNATKYTERGRVELRAHFDAGHFVLEVRDTGPGIPADKLDYIFEPFTRVDESRTRNTSGTGLGLAIARRLAELLGGEIGVRSTLGEGSTFTLRLPTALPLPASL